MLARTVTQYTQEQLEALWSDCSTDVVGRTMPLHDVDYCKSEVFRILNDQPIKMAVADDNNKDVSYLTGYKTEDDRFYILSGLHGRDTDGSKAWLYSSDYWSTVRQWIVDNNMTAYSGEGIKDEALYNHLLIVDELGLYPNATYSVTDECDRGDFITVNICFLHTE